MAPAWFKSRGYRHFDHPVGASFADVVQRPDFVSQHAFSPLIKFIKKSKRYKSDLHKTEWKLRPIMFAAHRDACILAYYSAQLDAALEAAYQRDGLHENVIAYRKLGRGNDAFSADAYRYAASNTPCMILAFDVTDFFGSLNHALLKKRLKEKLAVAELPSDWYQVFKSVTRYHYIERDALKANVEIGPRLKKRGIQPIATMAEVKRLGIAITASPTPGRGIPQGTPISAALSNLYLYDFDVEMLRYANEIGAFYRRYSDDILFICPPMFASAAEEKIRAHLVREKLAISEAKTERSLIDPASSAQAGRVAQYLGFAFYQSGPGIRASSLNRRWRKMRGAFKRKRALAKATVAEGKKFELSTRKMRRQFAPTGPRNFSTYARRAAATFGPGSAILRQVRKFERTFEREVATLKAEFPRELVK